MRQFLTRILAGFCNSGTRPRQADIDRRVRLNVEGLEDRLALSTSGLANIAPVLAPALQGDNISGTSGDIAMPLKCVHGYKWRPRPLAVTPAQAPQHEVGGLRADPTTGLQAARPNLAQVIHVAVGGADGILITVSGPGHVVVHPPEGPLPTEAGALAK